MDKISHLLHPAKESRAKQLEHFRQWAVAFVVCNFNVDLGPEIEVVYPPETSFSSSDLTAITFNSLPERNDTEPSTDDLSFHFTIRNNSPDVSLRSPCAPHGSSSDFYGHSIFRQEYDAMSKRRFNQRALVLISNHAFPVFFLRILQHMTVSGLICDPTALEAACSAISSWPPPTVGHLDLPFLGTLISLDIAPHAAFPLQGLGTISNSVPAAVQAYEPTGSWSTLIRVVPTLPTLYQIVERLLLCENIIVLAKSPQLCSEFISAAIDLIRPIPYAGECRPYMTMQSEFSFLVSTHRAPRHFFVGVTNPFLLTRIFQLSSTAGFPKPYVVNLTPTPPKRRRSRSLHHNSSTSSDLPAGIRVDENMRKYLKADATFIKDLEAAMTAEANLEAVGPFVRRQFSELTGQFLAPLNRYLASSMRRLNVRQKDEFGLETGHVPASPSEDGVGQAHYGNFSTKDFLSSLSKHGTAVKFRGQNAIQRHKARDTFYAHFCECPTFFSWLDMKLSLENESAAGLMNGGGQSKERDLS